MPIFIIFEMRITIEMISKHFDVRPGELPGRKNSFEHAICLNYDVRSCRACQNQIQIRFQGSPLIFRWPAEMPLWPNRGLKSSHQPDGVIKDGDCDLKDYKYSLILARLPASKSNLQASEGPTKQASPSVMPSQQTAVTARAIQAHPDDICSLPAPARQCTPYRWVLRSNGGWPVAG